MQAALRGCSRVSVDIDDLYHEQFVEMALADIGIRWSSRNPVLGYDRRGREGIQKQIENPDCVVTTQARSIQMARTVVWLRRDDRVLRFYRGETDRLMLIPYFPQGLESEGLVADETPIVGEAWTNGHAVIRVPNNPNAPVRQLTLAIDPERLPTNIRVAVLINGRPVLDDVVSLGRRRSNWSRTVELPDFGTEGWLDIEINSDTYVLFGDPRTLGARLRLLSLER